MKTLYRLKFLQKIGVITIIAIAFYSFLAFLIPKYQPSDPKSLVYTVRHQEIRDNNELYLDYFLKSIKNNDGYLVLGTSESIIHDHDANYHDFLNADTSLHSHFSLIAGAGRTACTYFPIIQTNKNVENLKVIYFINPCYWCGKFAYSNSDYFHRYTSYSVYKKSNITKNKEVDNIFKKNLRHPYVLDMFGDYFGYYANKIRQKYYQDLVFNIDSSRFYDNLSWYYDGICENKTFSTVRPDSVLHNYQYNVSADFDVNSIIMYPHPEETYRFEELETMIRLCSENNVDVVYVLGPYNRTAYQNYKSEDLPKIENVVEKIHAILEKNDCNYIDCTEISFENGTYNDWQHHSTYGAYLIYKKIRNYVQKNQNN